jgi:hypothetical protein
LPSNQSINQSIVHRKAFDEEPIETFSFHTIKAETVILKIVLRRAGKLRLGKKKINDSALRRTG